MRWGGSFEGAKANPSLPASGEKTDAAAQVAALAGRGPRRERSCVDHMRGARRPASRASGELHSTLHPTSSVRSGLIQRTSFLSSLAHLTTRTSRQENAQHASGCSGWPRRPGCAQRGRAGGRTTRSISSQSLSRNQTARKTSSSGTAKCAATALGT